MQRRARRSSLLALGIVTAAAAMPLVSAGNARADALSVAVDQANSGWDPSEPSLSPSTVPTIPTTPRLSVAVDGVVYAQPLVVGGVVVVATEHDRVYAIDAASGRQRWQTTVGAYEPDSHSCGQVTPHLGITATPVVDAATQTLYLTARDWGGSPSTTSWRVHALDLASGAERPGWPVTVAGHATNDPAGVAFDPYQHQQRPGLLLSHGQVFAGFGSFCDQTPYQGWIAGVSTSTRALHLWITEPGHGADAGGALWMSGGGLTTDGQSLFAGVANGTRAGSVPPVGPASSPTTTPLGNALVRLAVQPDGSLAATDYFAGWNADNQSGADADLGSSAPVLLPDAMGLPGHPHLLVVGDKYGTLYLLDRDNLGGRSPSQATEAAVVPGELNGVPSLFSHCSLWPGASRVLCVGSNGPLRAYSVQSGRPQGQALVAGADCGCTTGYGSGSPLVTSSGTAAGSALAWFTDTSGAQLVAYSADPDGSGHLRRVWAASIGSATRFTQLAAANGSVFVGAGDPSTGGRLLAFGTPQLFSGMYTLSGDGGVHGDGGSPTPTISGSWPGWDIARGIVLRADGRGGYTVDGFGGVHPFGGAPAVAITGYWPGWDIVRGLALRSDGQSGYTLDAFGGVHPFGGAPAVTITGYWPGWDIVRSIALRADGRGGYTLDGWGGVHPFGGAPAVAVSGYWTGWDIVRGLVLSGAGDNGYTLDGFGGVHPLGAAPPVAISGYWPGWMIARAITLLPGSTSQGWTVDGYGATHPFGGAPDAPSSWYTPGDDSVRGVAAS